MICINGASRSLEEVSKAGRNECLFADWQDRQLSNVTGREKTTGDNKFNTVLTMLTM